MLTYNVSLRRMMLLATLLGASIFMPAAADAQASFAVVAGTEEKAADAVREMYAAAQAHDAARFHAAVTPDFYVYEGGQRMSGDMLWGMLEKSSAAGNVYQWQVMQPEVHVVCDTAWITYVNKGSVTNAAGVVTELGWVESVIAELHDGRWRVRFFHSTRMPEPPK